MSGLTLLKNEFDTPLLDVMTVIQRTSQVISLGQRDFGITYSILHGRSGRDFQGSLWHGNLKTKKEKIFLIA